jgi:hypothetical protein
VRRMDGFARRPAAKSGLGSFRYLRILSLSLRSLEFVNQERRIVPHTLKRTCRNYYGGVYGAFPRPHEDTSSSVEQ